MGLTVVPAELPVRGSLVWLLLSPQAGSEQAGRHPGIVLSPAVYHRHSRLAIVCPITSRERGWPTEVKLPSGLPVSGVVLVDHIRSIDREARKLQIIGQAPDVVLEEINARLAPLLSL
jgi:mRNA interferase MazF